MSREVANLTWEKIHNFPVYGVKEFVCLSVCDDVYVSMASGGDESILGGPYLGIWSISYISV